MSWRYGNIQGTEHPNQRIKLILQLMSCGILSKINVIKLWNIILLYCSVSPCNYCLLLLQLANFVVSSDSVDTKNCHKFSKSTKLLFILSSGRFYQEDWMSVSDSMRSIRGAFTEPNKSSEKIPVKDSLNSGKLFNPLFLHVLPLWLHFRVLY